MKYGRLSMIFCLCASVTIAAEDYQQSIEKLKENAENAEHNYREYDANLKIVDSNLEQVEKALKELGESRESVQYHLKNSDANKAKLNGHKKQIDTFIAEEQRGILAEQKKLEILLAKVEQLKKNMGLREANIVAYQSKKAEIDQELADWSEQQQKISSLISKIDGKEKAALSEKKNWQAKRKGYQEESARWKKTAAQAKDLYRKYDKFD